MEELISRKLVMAQHSIQSEQQRVEGYFIVKQKLDNYDRQTKKSKPK
jgi:hypothetical protein